MTDLLFSTDIENATKEQLKSLVKAVREQFGRAIDLRKADINELRQYLQDYLATQVEEVTPEPEVTTSEIAEIETVNESPALSELPTLSYEIVELPTSDDPDFNAANEEFYFGDRADVEKAAEEGFYCHLPLELEKPPSFNKYTERSIAILLEFGTAYGNELNAEWIAGILKDCAWRASIRRSISEKLILSDPIFYGLAGHDLETIGLFNRIVRSPEEFGDIPKDMQKGANFYSNIGNLLGGEAVSAICQYHTIRDNLNYLQQLHGISSLEKRSKAVKDRLFEYFDYNDQMALLPSDRAVLKAEAPRIAEYFQTLTSDYEVYRSNDDESLERLPDDFCLMTAVAEADYAWIYAQSIDWKPSKDGYSGGHVDRLDPDEITVCLSKWDGDQYDGFLYLKAIHFDPSRRPWLANSLSS
ncbi:hypothetical protein [Tolypothrix sp. VBCCA 56010]|uniref:hypothetical protein n=1 Tax=Tolypothrix sp. VBCCA 56010 TaxID=3137731 RepID=UPI003D7CCC37